MRLPLIRGIIDRRILVNYRVDPAVLAQNLPLRSGQNFTAGMGWSAFA